MTTLQLPSSIPDVAHVELLSGAEADPAAPPSLLVEVPHGADETWHYERLAARLESELPEGLVGFFHVNTDVGAWAYGRATAQRLVERIPGAKALLVRSLVPRTFVDVNRALDFSGGEGLTPGMPPYVDRSADHRLLGDLHQQYVQLVEQAYRTVCGQGGLALVPHTYAPRSLDVQVTAAIVEDLRRGWAEPERWPLRAEVDLLTRDGEGKLWAPALEQELVAGFGAAGLTAVCNEAYYLHPVTLAYRWSTGYPGRVLCLEVRRDLLVEEWLPLAELRLSQEKCQGVAEVLAGALSTALSGAVEKPSAGP